MTRILLQNCTFIFNIYDINNLWSLTGFLWICYSCCRQHSGHNDCFFMPQRSKIGGILLICPVCHCHSIILSFCHSLWNFNLANNFWRWVLELWYFIWVFLVTKTFCGYHYFLPYDLDFEVWTIFEKLSLLTTFEQWELERWYFTGVILVTRPFRGYHYFLSLWPWPWSLTFKKKWH